MDNIIRTTGIASLAVQAFAFVFDTYVLAVVDTDSPDKKDLAFLLNIEYAVNIVEGMFYIWMLANLSKVKNITKYRYYDWMITTPVMLFTYSMYLLILKKKEEHQRHDVMTLIMSEKYILIAVALLNGLMLMFGYLGETKVMSIKLSTFMGFIPFIAMFYLIYENYAKHTSVGKATFVYFVIVWGLYGVAALMSYKLKNALYNILDLFSKNFFAIFLAYVLLYK